MSGRTRNILTWLPRRRERQWRYVSPGRRGAGFILLAVLTVAVAGYLLLPRWVNRWTRDEAAAYLRGLTGGQVTIREADFSLFGGIELRGVSIDVPNSPVHERFLDAPAVVLRHRPWSLLTEGRLEPTEIVCIGPTVTLAYDAEKGRYTAEELIAAARRARPLGSSDSALHGPLPAVSIRDVRLRLLSGQIRLDISMVPAGRTYRIILAEQRDGGAEPLRGIWTLDLATGNLNLVESKIPKLSSTDSILPAQYSEWRKRYNIRGTVVLRGTASDAPAGAILNAELEDVALRLQPEEGGFELAGVRGTLRFDQNGVDADELRGRIPLAGDAAFRMSGRYGGYDPNSPFELRVSVEGMGIPDGSGAAGWLADTLRFLTETYRPSGKLDIAASFRRARGGRVLVKGSARPLGMSFLYKQFPYPLERVTGSIDFVSDADGSQVTLTQVVGRRGRAEMAIRGTIDLVRKDWFDVTVTAKDLPLNEELRGALPTNSRAAWDEFRPSGSAGATVRVWRRPADRREQAQVTMVMDGRTSMAYQGFPYRLEGIDGTVRIDANQVTLEKVRGRHGPVVCTVDGTLLGPDGGRGETNLTIEAGNVPLDANLLAALPEEARKAVASLHAGGSAERISARLRQLPGQPSDLRVAVRLKDACLRPDALPYELRKVGGALTIRGGRVIVEDLSGVHGDTRVTLNGQVVMDPKTPGLDLHAAATGLEADEALLAALPQGLQRTLRELALRGRADVELSLRKDMPGLPRPLEYELTVQARGMDLCYKGFPYDLSGIVGRAVATPRGVKLEGLTARHGDARLTFQGELILDGNVAGADLSIAGSGVPIDEDLLRAMPESLRPLSARFQPGGACDLDLRRFVLRRAAASRPAESAPASAPAAGPSSLPAAPVAPMEWSADGQAAFRNATVDLGLGSKTLSGSLRGAAAQAAGFLSVDAAVELESVTLGRQKLTALRGKLVKQAGGPLLRLADLTARAHGGQVAGFAEVRLVEPLEFGVSLSVDGIQLRELFRGEPEGKAAAAKVAGSLAGNLQLTALAGPKPRQQASGVLRIYRAEIYRIPVMLGLLNVVFLDLPGETAFTDGELTYHLRDDKLVFEEVYLRGPALSIVGSGTMNMQTEALDLTFLSGPPRKLPRLGSLGELLEGIAREVAQIHVGGTLRQPEMRTVPLRSLDRLIRDLMNPGRAN